jgi:hypothetical protein
MERVHKRRTHLLQEKFLLQPPQRQPRMASRPVVDVELQPTWKLSISTRYRLILSVFAFCFLLLLLVLAVLSPEASSSLRRELRFFSASSTMHPSQVPVWRSFFASTNGANWKCQGNEGCPRKSDWANNPCGCQCDRPATAQQVACDLKGFPTQIEISNAYASGAMSSSAVLGFSKLLLIDMSAFEPNPFGTLEGDGEWLGGDGKRCAALPACDSRRMSCTLDMPSCALDTGIGAWEVMRQDTGGLGWNQCSSVTSDPCFGCPDRVECNLDDEGYVTTMTTMDLRGNNLVGELPAEPLTRALGETSPRYVKCCAWFA